VHSSTQIPGGARGSDAHVGAFFDVDNTLLPGLAIEVRFCRYLWKQGVIGWTEAAHSLWFWIRHVPPFSLHPLRQQNIYLDGKLSAEIDARAQEFVRYEICPRLSSHGLAKLESHRSAGHFVVLLTGSLDFLIAPLARYLNVAAVLCAKPERNLEGYYTGRVLPPLPYGDGKRFLLESFAQEHCLDLKACYAYGDSPGDVETLQLVGHPLVVNPIRGMARIARRQGWPITRWN